MIYIDFQGGAHGNYLEFVCNRFIAKIPGSSTPFNNLGASHNKLYGITPTFVAKHYFENPAELSQLAGNRVISIQVSPSDLLQLTSISLLRAGDHNLDNDTLEVDTYNKLGSLNYLWVRDNIVNSFFKNQIRDSYNAVKDVSWPTVDTVDDFQNLPTYIQDECKQVHQLNLLEFSVSNPDCPRSVLREFFKFSFKNTDLSGFITQQQKQVYDSTCDVYKFPYSAFYDTEEFVIQIQKIADWVDVDSLPLDEITKLHVQFLDRQPYKDSKIQCDAILNRLYNQEQFELPKITMLQESYINAQLELHYNKEIPVDTWFTHSSQIYSLGNNERRY